MDSPLPRSGLRRRVLAQRSAWFFNVRLIAATSAPCTLVQRSFSVQERWPNKKITLQDRPGASTVGTEEVVSRVLWVGGVSVGLPPVEVKSVCTWRHRKQSDPLPNGSDGESNVGS